mmetsp:Transcript_6352/g.16118  ORF Transcript_6352/g.16118 Transcript_6352/m.16118 type:complete len:283 (-) Transcript_6352:51-899(-)|eukprot:CAMPEP_0198237590 /NCGR_PEP_ID=MMETSP1446-20131203/3371_1 /TAXON_ID=1461542 ORGANISM="Unidentified sp, Strain CCMP2111" /NCGR_SAMPLE_ID=MMETSP1446 /ASSEMBLY_ACC=CAM_ASM_001112 /LENGTH=282 /DNA_ID=CAMNT_0043919759 /DNA_START=220 /DNA_END=1068 /DNA_ORIENTATION=-
MTSFSPASPSSGWKTPFGGTADVRAAMERSGKPAAEQAQRFVSMAVHQIGGQLRRVKWPWDSNGARNSQNASASILRPASLQEDARGGRQEPRSGTSFPGKVNVRGSGCADLCGVGMRRKRIAGIKDINVYAVGMYFNSGELKKVASRKKESQEKVLEDVIDQKGMKNVIRLVLVYPRVTGKMITVSLDEQIGSKLRKTGNHEDFVQFAKGFEGSKMKKGSVITLDSSRDGTVTTFIDGKMTNSLKSRPLSTALVDLYLGKKTIIPDLRSDALSQISKIAPR